MLHTYAFLIKDADEDYQGGVLIQSEENLTFDDIKEFVESVVTDVKMCDRNYARMADYETTYDITDVDGVPMPRFTFHNVSRRDWVLDATQVMVTKSNYYALLRLSASALAITVKNTIGLMGLGDVTGPLRGIPHLEI